LDHCPQLKGISSSPSSPLNILVLDAKGGENKGQSDKWISYHLRNFENRDFENSRIELFQNSFVVSLVKSWLLVGRSIDYGK
jgi:hypothetical protein